MSTSRMANGSSPNPAARSIPASEGAPTIPLRSKPRMEEAPTVPGPGFPELPGFEVVRVLGQGGMSTVYLARQRKLKRDVAIKMIRREDWHDPELRERFRREADSIAALEHPNVVRIYEVGEAQGIPFLALEYVSGGTLAGRIGGKALPSKLAATIARDLAKAVQAAHDQNIIHRDLKPANVLLSRRNSAKATASITIDDLGNSDDADHSHAQSLCPKISDFGLARFLTDDSRQTRSGFAIGTPSYMAPEQAAGHPSKVGIPADIYGLGAILYEMLTGRPPFQGDTAIQTVMMVRRDEPASPARINPNVPRDLETICLKCLEKDPCRRYSSAGELAQDLDRFLNGHPVKARPVGWLTRVAKWTKRRPTTAVTIGLGSLLTIALVVSLIVIQRMNSRLKQNGQSLPAAALTESEKTLQEKIDYAEQNPENCKAQLIAYDALMLEGKYQQARPYIEHALQIIGGVMQGPARPRNGPAEMVAETATVHDRWGDHLLLINEFKMAWSEHTEALTLRLDLVKQEPNERRWVMDASVSLEKMARLHMRLSTRDADQNAVDLLKQRLNLLEPLSEGKELDRAKALLETHNLLVELYWRMSELAKIEIHRSSAEEINQRYFQGRAPRFIVPKKSGPPMKK